MKLLPTLSGKKRSKSGFTLVEVTLTLGIIAVSVIPLLGLMSVGLSQAKIAVDCQAETRILQTVNAKLRQGGFADTTSAKLYFDRHGAEKPQQESLYLAEVSFGEVGLANQKVLVNALEKATIIVKHAPAGTPSGAGTSTNFAFVQK